MNEHVEVVTKIYAREAWKLKREHYQRKLNLINERKTRAQFRGQVLSQKFLDRLHRNERKAADAKTHFELANREATKTMQELWNKGSHLSLYLLRKTLEMESSFTSQHLKFIEQIEEAARQAASGESVRIEFEWRDMQEIGQAQNLKHQDQDKHRKKRFWWF
jgi:hypothetical protein